MSTLFIIFRVSCYVALAIVASSFLAMIILSNPDICPSLSTGSISCKNEMAEELAKLSMGVVLLSVFVGSAVTAGIYDATTR